jgi:hypothetical protein
MVNHLVEAEKGELKENLLHWLSVILSMYLKSWNSSPNQILPFSSWLTFCILPMQLPGILVEGISSLTITISS